MVLLHELFAKLLLLADVEWKGDVSDERQESRSSAASDFVADPQPVQTSRESVAVDQVLA